MAGDSMINCRLFDKPIAEGLCVEVLSVSGRLLMMDAVPELAPFTREQIQEVCDNCPYSAD